MRKKRTTIDFDRLEIANIKINVQRDGIRFTIFSCRKLTLTEIEEVILKELKRGKYKDDPPNSGDKIPIYTIIGCTPEDSQ